MKSLKTEIDFGSVHLLQKHDAGNLTREIAKVIEVNTDQIIADGAYRSAEAKTKPYRLTVTVELSEA
jgi:hypothetical protein